MDLIRHYLTVYDQSCQSPPTLASSDFLEQATLSVPTEVRGLEWGIVPSTKSLRRDHVQDILEIQEQTRNLNPTFRNRLLSSRSMKNSRPSRIVARLLGEGDAKTLQEQEPESRQDHETVTTDQMQDASHTLLVGIICM